MVDNIKGHLDVHRHLKFNISTIGLTTFPPNLIIGPPSPYNLSQIPENQASPVPYLLYLITIYVTLILPIIPHVLLLMALIFSPWTPFSSLGNPSISWPPEYLYECRFLHVTFLSQAFCGLSFTRRRNSSL